MTPDWPSATELKALKRSDPDRYVLALASIEERYGTAADAPPTPSPTGQRAGSDAFLDHLRQAFSLTEGQTSQLGYIRRGAVFACVTLRADMLSGLPIRVYRLGTEARGRHVDIRDPLTRLGMPVTARGVRLAEAGTVTEVEGSDLARRLSRPNEDWTGRMLIRMTEVGLGLTGQAHWQLHGRGPRADRPPAGLSWLRHDRVSVRKAGPRDDARTIAGWVLDEHTADRQEMQKGEVLWMRYPDPEDPDYGALAPSDIARLGADSYHDAMQSNRDIFRRGLQAAGLVMPPEDTGFMSEEQMDELARDLDRKLTSRSASRRLAVLKHRFDISSLETVSPREAEFVALMEFAIEDAARVYRVPIEFVGGTRRTYQNMEMALRGIWMMTLEPQACWLADELSTKLVPAFGDEADFVAFDLSGVVSLQEDEREKWRRAREQIETGVLLRNEWREDEGFGALPWGDAWWVRGGLVPVTTDDLPETTSLAPVPVEDEAVEDAPTADDKDTEEARTESTSRWAYGGDEHRRLMRRRDDTLAPHEQRVERVMRELLERQRDSILDQLAYQRAHTRISLQDLRDIFRFPRWVREFRERMRPELRRAAEAGGDDLHGSIGVPGGLDASEPAVINFLRSRSQRFAVRVNETTWEALKDSLAEGIEEGESIADLADRVSAVMASRLRSAPETVARTEALGAYSGGSLHAARQTGLDLEKTWLSALDERVRDDHRGAHGQTVAIEEDFEVGGAKGPGPGLMGEAAQDIQCRCTLVYGEKKRAATMPEIAPPQSAAEPVHA